MWYRNIEPAFSSIFQKSPTGPGFENSQQYSALWYIRIAALFASGQVCAHVRSRHFGFVMIAIDRPSLALYNHRAWAV
jgi:hypothetical protein